MALTFRAMIQQDLDDLFIARRRGFVQRRSAVFVFGVDGLWIGGQHLEDSCGIAGGSGIVQEIVGLPAMGTKERGNVGISPSVQNHRVATQ